MASAPHGPWQPLQQQRVFGHEAASVGAARRFAECTLAGWGIADRVDDVRLCVSELITNALVHGDPNAGDILVRFRMRDLLVRVEVHDTVTALPEQRTPDDGSDTGRGLLLVAACADGWGVEPHTSHKIVWAEFKVDAAAKIGGIAC